MLYRLSVLALFAAAGANGQWSASGTGQALHEEWEAAINASPTRWAPGAPLQADVTLTLTQRHLNALAALGIQADYLVCLLTAERTFDPSGKLRLPIDERMSTLLTPSGLPIEGGVAGAVTDRFGYAFRTPVDQLLGYLLETIPEEDGRRRITFEFREYLPGDLPPGIYRMRFDFGTYGNGRYYSLAGQSFAVRPSTTAGPADSHLYSPPILAGDSPIQPRIPWVLLRSYNSNGYQGVVADEDQSWFGLSGRNLFQDDVILPRYSTSNTALTYNLEPQFPTDTIEPRNNIPWSFNTGETSVEITAPDGSTVKHGPFPFVSGTTGAPTTRVPALTAWKPPAYGKYKVRATGWIQDVWGNRYEGGGTYQFWIAKRMTLATATFQGMSYPVGNRYGRDTAFNPPYPAEVEVEARLYANSNVNDARVVRYSGRATPYGVFGAAQGMQPLNFDAPGEYWARVLARYTDAGGHLWVCSMRHAGVVYPNDSTLVARGKKVYAGGRYLERGETKAEGYVDADGVAHLEHINFPYQPGDVLLIASEGQGANKIEPTLIWEEAGGGAPYDTSLQGIGRTNARLITSNGYSPHLYPEAIVDWAYYYAAGARPGFMGRVLVGEDGVRAPYWPTSPNSFGAQINATTNGDMPGDIYRLIGGVVLRPRSGAPRYAGYLASGFILPGGSKNNRVIAPGAEDLDGPHHCKARFFLVGTRPGMTYPLGSAFAPAVQIDPILPAQITFTLIYPDGRSVQASGVGDASGSFSGKDRWTLDVPGVYRYTLTADWQGYRGEMPGLPATGGEMFVVESSRPPGVPELTLTLPAESNLDPTLGLHIKGTTTASQVYLSALIPGAVLEVANLPVTNGQFDYYLDPKKFNLQTQTYDTQYRVTGKTELGDVIHLTFFSREQDGHGATAHSFARVLVRGTRVLYSK